MTVEPAQIGVALGRDGVPTPTEYAQWSLWISDATMLIGVRAGVLDIDVGDLDEAVVDYVIREAVVAHVRRPDNATQVTVAIQDASTSRTYQSGKGRVVILDEWWTMLGLVRSTGGAFSVDTAVGAGAHTAVCSLNFGALYCSCGADLTNYAYPLFGLEIDETFYGPIGP